MLYICSVNRFIVEIPIKHGEDRCTYTVYIHGDAFNVVLNLGLFCFDLHSFMCVFLFNVFHAFIKLCKFLFFIKTEDHPNLGHVWSISRSVSCKSAIVFQYVFFLQNINIK